MRQVFLNQSFGQYHFRIMGAGPPLVLLHPSPSSGEMLLPLARLLAAHFQVFIPDTPGYGLSDEPRKTDVLEMSDYAVYLAEALNSLGVERCAIYGTATGAQLGIRYALNYPNRVEHLFLDNTAHFTDEMREAILQDYFPDLNTRQDGSHLKRLWKMVSGMFMYFPWCWQEDEYRLAHRLPSANILQMVCNLFLQAGPGYDKAYRAAFKQEDVKYIQELTVATTLFRWDDSILLTYIDDLLAHSLPENIQVINTAEDHAERRSEMAEVIQGTNTGEEVNLNVLHLEEEGDGQFFLDTSVGRLHGWRKGGEKGSKKYLILHSYGSSATVSKSWADAIGVERYYCLSMPNHGESVSVESLSDDEEYYQIVLEIINLLNTGEEKLILSGLGWGYQLALTVCKQKGLKEEPIFISKKVEMPKRINKLRKDGMHLRNAWTYLKQYNFLTDEMRMLYLREWYKFRGQPRQQLQ